MVHVCTHILSHLVNKDGDIGSLHLIFRLRESHNYDDTPPPKL